MTENFRCLRGLCLDFSLPVLKEVEADPESAAATERHFPSDFAWAESCVLLIVSLSYCFQPQNNNPGNY